jgi:hypothetical protein
MDMSLVSAIIGAQAGNAQVSLAASFMRDNANAASSIAQMVESAAEGLDTLANVAQGVGTNLNIHV